MAYCSWDKKTKYTENVLVRFLAARWPK